jgi:hypothetical protein
MEMTQNEKYYPGKTRGNMRKKKKAPKKRRKWKEKTRNVRED